MADPTPQTPTIPTTPTTSTTPTTFIQLTPHPLNPTTYTTFVSSPSAGATVLFIGTTRNSFNNLPVSTLSYSSYTPLAMRTLSSIADAILANHGAEKIAIVHRLGECPVGEQSIVIAVSAKHRQAAWRAGEEALEMVKDKAEIWKLEVFVGGEGVWRANRDGVRGVRV
ncbi:Molybdopterin biosynthesis MoaE, partial [Massarina eburnea CBS 473.64]